MCILWNLESRCCLKFVLFLHLATLLICMDTYNMTSVWIIDLLYKDIFSDKIILESGEQLLTIAFSLLSWQQYSSTGHTDSVQVNHSYSKNKTYLPKHGCHINCTGTCTTFRCQPKQGKDLTCSVWHTLISDKICHPETIMYGMRCDSGNLCCVTQDVCVYIFGGELWHTAVSILCPQFTGLG